MSVRFARWFDVYQGIRAIAEARRGVVQDVDGEHPNTTVGDAFKIAVVFDKAVYDHLPTSFTDRWTVMAERLVGVPDDGAPYAENAALWSMLSAAALELDRVGAPLPAIELVSDAIVELQYDEDAAVSEPELRNAGTPLPGILTQFREPSWRAMTLRQLGFFRALCGEVPGLYSIAPGVPATTHADVLALGRYWEQQLALQVDVAASAPHQAYHQLVYAWWYAALRDARRAAVNGDALAVYPKNAQFWFAMLMLATQSRHANAVPMPWSFRIGPRNAAPSTATSAPTATAEAALSFPSAPTWDDAARMQRDRLAQVRGFDFVENQLVSRVPRTTLNDVRNLTAYWTIGLARVGQRHEKDISAGPVLARWRAEAARVWAVPASASPDAVYAHNADFWSSVMAVAIQVGVTAEAPPPFTITDALVDQLKEKTLGALGFLGDLALHFPAKVLWGLPSKLWDATVGRLVDAALGAGEDAARGAARPLLWAGGAALGLTAVYLLFRGK